MEQVKRRLPVSRDAEDPENCENVRQAICPMILTDGWPAAKPLFRRGHIVQIIAALEPKRHESGNYRHGARKQEHRGQLGGSGRRPTSSSSGPYRLNGHNSPLR